MMTVKDLIEELRKYDESRVVAVERFVPMLGQELLELSGVEERADSIEDSKIVVLT